MAFQCLHGGLFVQLEGDDQVGLQVARKLAHHHHGIAAVGAGGCRRMLVGDDLTGAVAADIDPKAFFLPLGPFAAGCGIPGHIVGGFLLEDFVICLEGLHFKFRVAVGTLHLLRGGAEFDGTVTAGAFVLLKDCQNGHSLL